MNNDELLIKIKADTDKATKEIGKLNKEVVTLTKQVNKSKTSLAGQKTAFGNVAASSQKLSGLFAKITLGLGAMGIAMKGVDFANMAADAEQSADAFDKVVTDMGEDSVKVFEEIKAAAQGLIPDAAIKQSATTAISLGVPLTKLAQLMEVARAKSREMGTDAQKAFEDLATGIGRGSPMILDNLGLTIKLGDANQKMADKLGKTVKELTKQEKTMALTNAVLESGAESVERYSDASLTTKEKIAAMNASLDNLKVAIGSALLKPLGKLVEETTKWADSINETDIKSFEGKVKSATGVLQDMYDIIKLLNDVSMPDFLVGRKDATFTSETALQIQNIADTIDVWADAYEGIFEAQDKLFATGAEYDILSDKINKFTGTSDDFAMLDNALVKTLEDSSALFDKWSNSKNPEAFKDKLEPLQEIINKLGDAYVDLQSKKPFEPTITSADLAKDAVEGLTEATVKLTKEEIKALEKLNKQRVKDHTKSLKTLEKDEERLAKEILKLNEALAKDLADIEQDRFKTRQDVQSQIADLERGGMSNDAAYYDRQKDAEKALSDAKIALKAGEFEKYQYYIEQYKSLVTDSAGQEIKEGERVAVSKEETTRRAIAGLKTYSSMMDSFYSSQAAAAKAAHDTEVALKESEIDLVRLKIEAEMELLKLLAESKGVEIDTSSVDAVLAKIEGLKTGLDSIRNMTTPVKTDTTQIDAAKQKVEALRTLTINGVTLEVDANTTPADYGIEKLITKADGDKITMDVNPEYEAAENELDAFRKGESKDDIVVDVDADTKDAEKKKKTLEKPTESKHTVKDNASEIKENIDKLKTPTDSKHTVKDNVPAVLSDINRLKVTTHSDHIVHVKKVYANAGGGSIPKQNLASGGVYTGSGRVPGYDPTDSDKVNAALTGGEYVIKRTAVDNIGLATLDAINNLRKLPGYADGGLVGGASSSTSTSSSLQPVVINFEGRSVSAKMTPIEVMDALEMGINTYGGQ